MLVGLVVFAAAMLLALAFTAICNGLVRRAGRENLIYYEYASTLEKRDYVLVPGSAVLDGQVSFVLEKRLSRAVDLYEDGLVEWVVVSGSWQEAIAMEQYLSRRGVPGSVIWRDNYGLSTRDTLARAGQAYPGKTFYFPTQEHYARRAAFIMEASGLSGQCINADLILYQWTLKGELREYLASVKAVAESGILHLPSEYGVDLFPFMQSGVAP